MKKIFSAIILIFVISFAFAQPCKTVNPGMTKPDVIKAAGEPTSIDFLGVENGSDSLTLWNYVNQQVVFSGNYVDRVKVDVKKESELAKDMMDGKLTLEQFSEQIEQLTKAGCK